MSTVKIQVPIDKDIRDQWEGYAHYNGFDSLQAYIRFIAKADVDGRRVNFEESVRLSPEAEARYAKEIAENEKLRRQGKLKSYDNVDDFMRDLLSDEED
ncbi:MAG TPA: hypothetical protein VGS08_00175 [Candidatus Saccharimonadales bacterium]|nr:hypothetical protein [Candidatus Saccharimonadales bacterium]